MNFSSSSLLCIVSTALVVNVAATHNTVQAEGLYGEIGLTPVHVKSEAGDVSHPQAMRFLIGTDLHENLALEALYVATYSKDSRPGFDAKATHYGLMLKPQYSITNETIAFARVGVAHANFTASSAGSRTGTDLAYGVGLQTNFSKSVYGQIDYMNYYDKEGQSSKAYTLSVGTRF